MKKKAIAILTQPLGMNYGGILQNYALQKTLQKLGHKPVTVNRLLNHNVSSLRAALYYFKIENTIYKKTFNFLKKYISLTRKIDSNQKIIDHFATTKYDAIIVGSDQTWRPKMSPNIYNYFLDFLPANTKMKKISYASSFGTSKWEFSEDQTATIKPLISRFDAISVREKSGVELCKQYLDADATHVLDPTMLLYKEDYDKLFSNKGYLENRGIFAYVLDKKSETDVVLQKISGYFNKDVFRNQSKTTYSNEKSKKFPAVETWVKSFDDADFIVTDSFHGTVFSIIYQKRFISIINKDRGAARFYSLLEPLGLSHRLVETADEVNFELLNEVIDYKLVEKKLNVLREKSLSFLQDALT